jgi:hypothetical protein
MAWYGHTQQQAETVWRLHRPSMVGFSVPFPGALYASFRLARRTRSRR